MGGGEVKFDSGRAGAPKPADDYQTTKTSDAFPETPEICQREVASYSNDGCCACDDMKAPPAGAQKGAESVLAETCQGPKEQIASADRYGRLMSKLEKDPAFRKYLKSAESEIKAIVYKAAELGEGDPQNVMRLLGDALKYRSRNEGATPEREYLARIPVELEKIRESGIVDRAGETSTLAFVYAKLHHSVLEKEIPCLVLAAKNAGVSPHVAFQIFKYAVKKGDDTEWGNVYKMRHLTGSLCRMRPLLESGRIPRDRLLSAAISVIKESGRDVDIALQELPERLMAKASEGGVSAAMRALEGDREVAKYLSWRSGDIVRYGLLAPEDLQAIVTTCVSNGISDSAQIKKLILAMADRAQHTSYTTIRDVGVDAQKDIKDLVKSGVTEPCELADLAVISIRDCFGYVDYDIKPYLEAAAKSGFTRREAIEILKGVEKIDNKGFSRLFTIRSLRNEMESGSIADCVQSFGAVAVTKHLRTIFEGAGAMSPYAVAAFKDLGPNLALSKTDPEIMKKLLAAAARYTKWTSRNDYFADASGLFQSIWLAEVIGLAEEKDIDRFFGALSKPSGEWGNQTQARVGQLADLLDSRGITDPSEKTAIIAALLEERANVRSYDPVVLTDFVVQMKGEGKTIEEIGRAVSITGCGAGTIGEYKRFVGAMKEHGMSQKRIDDLIDRKAARCGIDKRRAAMSLLRMLDAVDVLGLDRMKSGEFLRMLEKGVVETPLEGPFSTGAGVFAKIEPSKEARMKFFEKYGPDEFLQFICFLGNSKGDPRLAGATRAIDVHDPEKFMAMCQQLKKKKGLVDWKNYSIEVADYLLSPEKYDSSYDIRVVETSTEDDVYAALRALPDHSQPRVELNGHGNQFSTTLAAEGRFDMSVEEALGLSRIARTDYFAKLDWETQMKIAQGIETFGAKRIGVAPERRTIDVHDEEWVEFKPKFAPPPDGKSPVKKKPLVFVITKADHNGGFNGMHKHLEMLIGHRRDTSGDPAEINWHSCSTGKGDENVSNAISERLGGVGGMAPPEDVSSDLIERDGRVTPVFRKDGQVVPPKVYGKK